MRRRVVVWASAFPAASTLLAVLAVGGATSALALWPATTTDSGAARSYAMALPAGNVPGVDSPLGTPTVNVSWAAATDGAPVAGYEISAFEATTGTPRSVGGGCAGVVSGTSCTDTGVPNGTWKYSVTARQQLWRGAGSPRSAPVAVS